VASLDATLAEARASLDGLSAERDSLSQQAESLRRELEEAAAKTAALTKERDEARANIQRINARLDQEKQESDSLAEQRDAALRNNSELSTRLAESQKQIEQLVRDQDRARRAKTELQSRISELEISLAAGVSAAAGAPDLGKELTEARAQTAALEEARDKAAHEADRLAGEMAALQTKFDDLARDHETLRASGDEAAAKLTETTRRLDDIAAARAGLETEVGELRKLADSLEAARAASDAQRSQLEKDLAAARSAAAEKRPAHDLTSQIEALKEQLAEAIRQRDEFSSSNRDLFGRVEEQRKQIVSLAQQHEEAAARADQFAAQLQSIQQDLATRSREAAELAGEEPPASAAPAYPPSRFADRPKPPALRPTPQRPAEELPAARFQGEPDFGGSPRGGSPVPEPQPVGGPGFSSAPIPRQSASVGIANEATVTQVRAALRDAPKAVASMRNCIQYFIRHPRDFRVLGQLQTHIQALAKKTAPLEFHALHRVATTSDGLIADLTRVPDQINKGNLRTLNQALDLLAVLTDERTAIRAIELQVPSVLHVDDDAEVRVEITTALEPLAAELVSADNPRTGIQELMARIFDLIILDVNMPGISGLDLCARIRSLPDYKTTPIIFLTGSVTAEMRAQSTLLGGNDFIAKPFVYSEIALKALTWIYKGQLGLM
jgi:CheY-like chemotaxis protein